MAASRDAFVRSDKPVPFLSLCCIAMLLGCVQSQSPPNAAEQPSGLNRSPTPLVREMGTDFLMFWKEYNFFVLFYVPWCQPSAEVMPLMEELAVAFQNTSVNFIRCDVSEHGDVAKYFKISGTPTIKFLKMGIPHDFTDSPSSILGLVMFVSRLLSPVLFLVNSTAQLEEFRGNFTVLFLLVHPQETQKEWQSLYQQVAQERVLDSVFLYTGSQDIALNLSLKYTPTLLVLKDSTYYEYKDSLSSYAMGVWVDHEKFPSFPEVNYTTARRYFTRLSPGRKLVILSTPESTLSDTLTRCVETVREIAVERKLNRAYQFLWNKGQELVERMTQQSVELPLLLVWDPDTNVYYTYRESTTSAAFTKSSIVRFLLDVSKDKIKAEGGPSLMDRAILFLQIAYGAGHATVIHRPIVAITAIAFLLGGIILCCGSRFSKRDRTRQRRQLVARRRGRGSVQPREQLTANGTREEEEEDSEGNTDTLRRRQTGGQ